MVPKPLKFSGNLNNTSEPLLSEKVKAEGKEILYEGFYYDVSSFIQRHPGGNVIKFYTEPGEDATMAIQQFHHRSMKQVLAIMKSLPKRPASQVKGNFNKLNLLKISY
jgi:cytochrome b involved in lipid metabolism